MAGAYTALPDTDNTPDVPPGWNPNWPHPGPSPPGYTPDYSLDIAGSGTTESAYVPTVLLVDHDAYATQNPSGKTIVWTATIDDETVQVKLNEEDEFSDSVSSSYSEQDDAFWGAEPTIIFDIDGSNAGDTIVLTATSVIFNNETVHQTHEITVTFTATFVITWSYTNGGPDPGDETGLVGTIMFGDGSTIPDSLTEPGGEYFHASLNNELWGAVEVEFQGNEGEFELSSDTDSVTLTINSFRSGVTYELYSQCSLTGSVSTPNPVGHMYITATIAGTEYTLDVPLVVDDFFTYDPWLTIDGDTGEVTIIHE